MPLQGKAMQRGHMKNNPRREAWFGPMAATCWLIAVVMALAGCGGAVPSGRQARVCFVRTPAQDIDLVEVSRTVPADGPLAQLVLEELLKGPTQAERRQGLTTLIPAGVVVKSVTLDSGGTMHVDFNEALQEGVGGSMRVTGIRRQIQATLLWIPGVTSVILSIEGSTEDILQP